VEGDLLAQMVRTLATPDGAPRTPLGSLVDETLSRLVLRERRRSGDEAPAAPPAGDPAPPAAADDARVPLEDGPTAAASDAAPPEMPPPEEAVQPTAQPGVRLPATLNPAIADALVALLASAAEGAEAGVVFEEADVFVPVERLTARGLDAGLAVRTLYDAGLLRPQGARKVWRRRVAGSEVAGVTLRLPSADRAVAP
jgi:hypothetical protein